MAERIHSITLALEENMRVEDAKALLNACKLLKGVVRAKGNISNHEIYVAEARVRQELGEKLWEVIYPKTGDK